MFFVIECVADSVFKKRQFIFPELRENLELLVAYYQKNNDHPKEFAYTKDLLKVDSIFRKDSPHLSSKIHRGYDNQILKEANTQSENRNSWNFGIIFILTVVVILMFVLIWKYYQNEKQIKQSYSEIEKNLQQKNEKISVSYEEISEQKKSLISEEIFEDIQKKLNDFENQKGFKEKNLTSEQLADNFRTNKSYLSEYINNIKGMHFSKYISTLRINYITQLMYNDPKYLKLKIQGLADECGIVSRTNFSDLFSEINGIRPNDFLRQRKQEFPKS